MDLHNRLKELNNLPENGAVKARIYEGILQPKKKPSFAKWKEAFITIAMAVIALFLIIVPESIQDNQTASDSVQEIYSKFGGKEGKFFARGSTLYMSVDKIEDQTVYTFFENLSLYMKETDGQLGDHIADVVVVRAGEEERYQLSDTGMLHVETGKFYSSESDMYADVFNILYSVTLDPWYWYIILPFVVIIVNIVSATYYKRRKLQVVNPFIGKPWIYILLFGALSSVFGWGIWIGPLFKPLLVILALFYGISMWYASKRSVQSYAAYKFETVKIIVITVTIIIVLALT